MNKEKEGGGRAGQERCCELYLMCWKKSLSSQLQGMARRRAAAGVRIAEQGAGCGHTGGGRGLNRAGGAKELANQALMIQSCQANYVSLAAHLHEILHCRRGAGGEGVAGGRSVGRTRRSRQAQGALQCKHGAGWALRRSRQQAGRRTEPFSANTAPVGLSGAPAPPQ